MLRWARVFARVHCNADLADHLACADHFFAGGVTAFVGHDLVIELDGIGAAALQYVHRIPRLGTVIPAANVLANVLDEARDSCTQ